MGKQWISLLIFGFVVCATVIGWDFFLAANGLKSAFIYTVTPIETDLYERITNHVQRSPKINEYAAEAERIESIDEFFPREN